MAGCLVTSIPWSRASQSFPGPSRRRSRTAIDPLLRHSRRRLMNREMAMVWVARGWRAKSIRPDQDKGSHAWELDGFWAWAAALVGLALAFVVIGAVNFDLGPSEARVGLAAGERIAPLGQLFGYW